MYQHQKAVVDSFDFSHSNGKADRSVINPLKYTPHNSYNSREWFADFIPAEHMHTNMAHGTAKGAARYMPTFSGGHSFKSAEHMPERFRVKEYDMGPGVPLHASVSDETLILSRAYVGDEYEQWLKTTLDKMDEIDTFNHILDTTARPKRAERPPYVKQPKAVKTAPLDATADAKTPATTGVVVQPINAGGGGSGGSGGGKAVVESKTDADGVEEDDIFSVTAPAPDYIPRDLHTLFKNVRDAPDKSVINYNIINKINKKMKEDGHKKLHGNAKSKESVLRGIEKAYNSSKL